MWCLHVYRPASPAVMWYITREQSNATLSLIFFLFCCFLQSVWDESARLSFYDETTETSFHTKSTFLIELLFLYLYWLCITYNNYSNISNIYLIYLMLLLLFVLCQWFWLSCFPLFVVQLSISSSFAVPPANQLQMCPLSTFRVFFLALIHWNTEFCTYFDFILVLCFVP